MIKIVLIALAMFFCLHPRIAAAQSPQCGIVNGQEVCTTPPGCGFVNGAYYCANAPGCGYVNGSYSCPGDTTGAGGTPTTSGSTASGEFPAIRNECSWYNLPCNMNSLIGWMRGAILAVPRILFASLMLAAGTQLQDIPVPESIAAIGPSFAAIGGSVGWFAYVFALKVGVGYIFGALLLRFLIRRIPFVG